jgi:outer membrane autotransporter protein
VRGPGLDAIERLTAEERKGMIERSGGSIPGLFGYAGDGSAATADGAAAADAVDPVRYQAWASVRYTGVTTTSALNNLEGGQVNGMLGLNYRLNPQIVIGAFGGYETMSFDDDSTAKFEGEGLTGGVYGAWRPSNGLRLDAQISGTRLGYDVQSGAVTGSFDATRVIAAGGITGQTKFGDIMLEPSLRATAVWENQEGYTDSVGTLYGKRSFNFGKIAAGLKASRTFTLDAGRSVTPYAGVAADYRFSGGDTTATLEALDDFSLSLNAGLNAKLNSSTSLGLDGTVSGLGLDDILIWSLRARLGVDF